MRSRAAASAWSRAWRSSMAEGTPRRAALPPAALPPEPGAAPSCGVLSREPLVSQPFHFAFFVRDLASTRRFYGAILGCREGRSTETWVDFDFFGNQISRPQHR